MPWPAHPLRSRDSRQSGKQPGFAIEVWTAEQENPGLDEPLHLILSLLLLFGVLLLQLLGGPGQPVAVERLVGLFDRSLNALEEAIKLHSQLRTVWVRDNRDSEPGSLIQGLFTSEVLAKKFFCRAAGARVWLAGTAEFQWLSRAPSGSRFRPARRRAGLRKRVCSCRSYLQISAGTFSIVSYSIATLR